MMKKSIAHRLFNTLFLSNNECGEKKDEKGEIDLRGAMIKGEQKV